MANTPKVIVNPYQQGARIWTPAQLAAFANQNASNYISYWDYRNATSLYNWMKANYVMSPVVGQGLNGTLSNINAVHDFLLSQYNALPAAQQAHWLHQLGASMPVTPELTNWTTPINS